MLPQICRRYIKSLKRQTEQMCIRDSVWAYSTGGIGVSDTGYFGTYSGFSKDKSIIARMITADWIRTGVLSALDDTLQIDLESGQQIIQAAEGWGQTVLDGIGALFKYWNKNITSAETEGHPPLAYLLISADADEMASSENKIAADLKLVWATYDGKKHTSIGHTLVHATDGSEIESFHPFEIKSDDPVHVSPGLYYDDALLFDNIIMRRTNTVQEMCIRDRSGTAQDSQGLGRALFLRGGGRWRHTRDTPACKLSECKPYNQDNRYSQRHNQLHTYQDDIGSHAL